jgi:hypothetical protein
MLPSLPGPMLRWHGLRHPAKLGGRAPARIGYQPRRSALVAACAPKATTSAPRG